MALVSVRCPNDSGEIQVDDTKEIGVCYYCGTSFRVKDAIAQFKVRIDPETILKVNEEYENAKKQKEKLQ